MIEIYSAKCDCKKSTENISGFFFFVQLKMMLHVNARISANTSVKELSLTLGYLYVYLNSNVLFFFFLLI